jgi:hypothetical protein
MPIPPETEVLGTSDACDDAILLTFWGARNKPILDGLGLGGDDGVRGTASCKVHREPRAPGSSAQPENCFDTDLGVTDCSLPASHRDSVCVCVCVFGVFTRCPLRPPCQTLLQPRNPLQPAHPVPTYSLTTVDATDPPPAPSN